MTQQEPDYLIKESQVKALEETLDEYGLWATAAGVRKSFRSRPASTCVEDITLEGAAIVQSAKKAERERVLDTFAEVEYLHDVDGITYPDLYNEFIQRYKKLRTDSTGDDER